MSVIVKGMEMPKRCSDCELEEHDEYELTHECRLIYKGYTNNFRMFERHKNCPLVALPDKHGRLIDADELKTAFPRCDNNMDIKIASVRATINHMPTIIEAEGVEE